MNDAWEILSQGRRCLVLVMASLHFAALTFGSETESSDSRALLAYLPVGKSVRALSIPTYVDSRLTSTLRCTELTKITKEFLLLRGVEIQTYYKEGALDQTIHAEEAYYHMDKSYVCGEGKLVIESSAGIRVSGEGFVFDTKRQIGGIEKAIKLRIPDPPTEAKAKAP